MGSKPGVAPQQRRSSPSRDAGWAVQQHRYPRSDGSEPQQRFTCSGIPAKPGAQPRVVCCVRATPLHNHHSRAKPGNRVRQFVALTFNDPRASNRGTRNGSRSEPGFFCAGNFNSPGTRRSRAAQPIVVLPATLCRRYIV